MKIFISFHLFFDSKLEIQKLELSKDFVCTAARLVGDNNIEPHGSKGRVEVVYNGTWRKVCGDDYYWDFTHANIVCRQLGFPGALVTARTSQSRRRASGLREMWFRSRCEGNETEVTNCYQDRWSSYCSKRNEAYVKCITGDELFLF